jgi:hypothetical protein
VQDLLHVDVEHGVSKFTHQGLANSHIEGSGVEGSQSGWCGDYVEPLFYWDILKINVFGAFGQISETLLLFLSKWTWTCDLIKA